MSKFYELQADNGVPFKVRVVFQGERYGLKDAVQHLDAEPLVEFYDRRFDHTIYGQFVSRYSLLTVCGAVGGLNLQGGVPEWQIDHLSMEKVKAFLVGATQ